MHGAGKFRQYCYLFKIICLINLKTCSEAILTHGSSESLSDHESGRVQIWSSLEVMHMLLSHICALTLNGKTPADLNLAQSLVRCAVLQICVSKEIIALAMPFISLLFTPVSISSYAECSPPCFGLSDGHAASSRRTCAEETAKKQRHRCTTCCMKEPPSCVTAHLVRCPGSCSRQIRQVCLHCLTEATEDINTKVTSVWMGCHHFNRLMKPLMSHT